MSELDFSGLAGVLLSRWEEWLPSWCPGGKLIGKEFAAGTVRGGPGDSFRFNIDKGVWSDFSTGEAGGDMIALYATVQGIKNGEAAKRLADIINYKLSDAPYKQDTTPKLTTEHNLIKPPAGTEEPAMAHGTYGLPSDSWCYRDEDGEQIFWEARYDTPKGKQILPWSWSDSTGQWVSKRFPYPMPLYGLDELARRPSAPVVVVEGPKCARVAQEVMGSAYVAVTWHGGSSSATKTDWTPLKGRNLLIWPDADGPGVKAANQIARITEDICPQIKVLDVEGMPDKWDVADAVADGWDWGKIKDWAVPRAQLIAKATAVAVSTNGHAPAVAIAQTNVVVNTSDDEAISQSASALLSEYGIACNKQGIPHCNIDNALRALDKCPFIANIGWFDTFQQKIYTTWNGPQREWTDRDTLELTKLLQRELGFVRLSDTTCFQALTLYAHAHPRNEPREWMESLTWDKQDRIEEFFINYLGAKDSAYVRATSRNFWLGMVARIFQPGCKMDNMVVLEGLQGTMKSTALHRIGGKWFTETNESVSNKDFFLILQGNLLVEIAELHTFSKAEVTRIKQVITCRVDRYRAPYERLVSDHPRQSVFVGSTNEDTYLKDTTGNRRFWPIKCGTIRPDDITAAREQLFAEATFKFKAGSTWWEMPHAETLSEQDERRQTDAWETMIQEWLYFENRDSVTTAEVLGLALKIEAGRMDKPSQLRVGQILKGFGWESCRDWNKGTPRRIWRRPGSELPLVEQ